MSLTAGVETRREDERGPGAQETRQCRTCRLHLQEQDSSMTWPAKLFRCFSSPGVLSLAQKSTSATPPTRPCRLSGGDGSDVGGEDRESGLRGSEDRSPLLFLHCGFGPERSRRPRVRQSPEHGGLWFLPSPDSGKHLKPSCYTSRRPSAVVQPEHGRGGPGWSSVKGPWTLQARLPGQPQAGHSYAR